MTALETISKKLNVNPAWLWSLIQFESRGNPAARNPITGARGLIQFLHSTAKSLGYKDADDLAKQNPTFDKQLVGPVYKYLAQYAPFPSKQSLYMAVFYPAARSWPRSSFFPLPVRQSNPGIDTVQNYIDFVEGKKPVPKPIAFLALLAIAGIAALVYYTSSGGRRVQL